MKRRALLLALFVCLAAGAMAAERFPPPDFGPDYTYPQSNQAPARIGAMAWVDMGALVAALGVGALAVHRWRSRRVMYWLTIFSIGYFGFYRKGCICAIGAIQNVAQGLFDKSYIVPLAALAFFTLPLLFALVWGRVFCGGVCPLGAMQELALVRAAKIPRWLDQGLGLLRYFYLGLAVLFAATASRYIICQYDPFVGFFRMAGRFNILVWSGAVLALSVFVGRPYCRWLCPYGVLIGWCSSVARRRVRITAGQCVNCHLCQPACPYGAIRPARRTPEVVS